MASMAKVDCSLEDGHDLDPLRLRNETELGNGRITNGAAGNATSSDKGLALLEDRIDVLGPDLLHEDGDRGRGPEIEPREDLKGRELAAERDHTTYRGKQRMAKAYLRFEDDGRLLESDADVRMSAGVEERLDDGAKEVATVADVVLEAEDVDGEDVL